MVKRLSVVNLENFRRQYARRRWKVKSRRGFASHVFNMVQRLVSFFFSLSLSSDQQLSFRIVALCNHLTRIMKKGHKLPEDGVRVVSNWIINYKFKGLGRWCVMCAERMQ